MRMLIHDCEVVVTMDDAGTEIAGGSILIEDGADRLGGNRGGAVAGAGGCRGGRRPRPGGHPRPRQHAPPPVPDDDARFRAAVGPVRLADARCIRCGRAWTPSGCGPARWSGWPSWPSRAARPSTDHHYLFPRGSGDLLAAEIDAAPPIGLRFHPCRGSMDVGQSSGGLPPDDVVEDADAVLADTEEAVGRHHDPADGGMVRIAVGPCSPFSVSDRLMRESASLARRLGRPAAHAHRRDAGRGGLLPRAVRHAPGRAAGRPGVPGRGRVARALRAPVGTGTSPGSPRRAPGSPSAPPRTSAWGRASRRVRALLDAGAPRRAGRRRIGVERLGRSAGGGPAGDAGGARRRRPRRPDRAGRAPRRDARRRGMSSAAHEIWLDRAGKAGRRGAVRRVGVAPAGADADPVGALLFSPPRGVRRPLRGGTDGRARRTPHGRRRERPSRPKAIASAAGSRNGRASA